MLSVQVLEWSDESSLCHFCFFFPRVPATTKINCLPKPWQNGFGAVRGPVHSPKMASHALPKSFKESDPLQHVSLFSWNPPSTNKINHTSKPIIDVISVNKNEKRQTFWIFFSLPKSHNHIKAFPGFFARTLIPQNIPNNSPDGNNPLSESIWKGVLRDSVISPV